MPIKLINARQIFDSCGVPTVEVDMVTELGLFRVGVPSTDLKKLHEAVPLRDNDPQLYQGQGITKAITMINSIIAPELIKMGFEVTQQRDIDNFLLTLDATEDRSRLGANSILVVSLVVAKAASAKKGTPLYRHISDLAEVKYIMLPVPHFTILVGGILSSNNLPFQEYLVLPVGAPSYTEAMRIGTEFYIYVKNLIEGKFGIERTYVADNGGFTAPFEDHKEAMIFLNTAIRQCALQGKLMIGLNAAASFFYKDGAYDINFKNPNSNPQEYLSAEQLCEFYLDDMREFPLVSVEDPFDNEDWEAWSNITMRTTNQILASDLIQTNLQQVGLLLEKKAANSVTLRLSQCATLTEMLDIFRTLVNNRLGVVVMDRLGDTDDTFIADMVVGLGACQLKAGAPHHSERIGKYNQILRIEEELGPLAKYAGKNYRPGPEATQKKKK
ncbi:Enolase [Eumeta japonica]|uniref:Enolase n=1 Tax=Eumeta variegata TaxID=151549 RepID=A0A4C1YJT9_EUMVA|nr:Enolase [Eumeta japonica]